MAHRGSRIAFAWATALLLAVLASAHAQESQLSDGIFQMGAGHWVTAGPFSFQANPVVDTVSQFTAAQRATNGNPDQHAHVELRYPGVASGLTVSWGMIFNEQLSHDPARSGAITRINFYFDGRNSSGVATSLAVRQNGMYWFVNDRRLVLPTSSMWAPRQITDITAADFRFLSYFGQPGQPAQPDFSVSGTPLTFGLVLGASCGSAGSSCGAGTTRSAEADFDNWRVVINPSPGIRFSQDEYAVLEDAGEVVLTVQRLGDTRVPASVLLSTDDITAGIANYTPVTDRLLQFAVGEDSVETSIAVHDTEEYGDRQFQARLHNEVGASLGEPAVASVFILDKSAAGCAQATTVADAGTSDPCIPGLPGMLAVTSAPGDVWNFPGITAGFNDLPYRRTLSWQVNNSGPAPVTRLQFELRIPKEHLAGYGITYAAEERVTAKGDLQRCDVPIAGDPVFVIIQCEYRFADNRSLAATESMRVPDAVHDVVIGYAASVPSGRSFQYELTLTGSQPADHDTTNNHAVSSLTPSPTPVPPPGPVGGTGGGSSSGRGGGGSFALFWLALLALWTAGTLAARVVTSLPPAAR